jgi:hypothetical protein
MVMGHTQSCKILSFAPSYTNGIAVSESDKHRYIYSLGRDALSAMVFAIEVSKKAAIRSFNLWQFSESKSSRHDIIVALNCISSPPELNDAWDVGMIEDDLHSAFREASVRLGPNLIRDIISREPEGDA